MLSWIRHATRYPSPQEITDPMTAFSARKKYALLWLPFLALTSVMSIILATVSGSLNIGYSEFFALLQGEASDLIHTVVLELRLPRALSAWITGAQLALAGCLMQVLLRNPLADPYVLGVSGGAATGALLAIMSGLGGLFISGSAFIGAMVNLILVFGLSHGQGSWSPTRLLLTGVVTAAGWGAIISFLLSVSPDNHLKGMLFWLMGDLSHASHQQWHIWVLLISLLISWPLARPLNLMLRGENQAKALGVPVYRIQLTLYLMASLLTASAVTQAGSIGFLGLVIPHLLRLLTGSDHRVLLPASVMAGGTLLVLADTFSRTIIAPQQLPVGVITAFIGVPLFLWVLQKHNR